MNPNLDLTRRWFLSGCGLSLGALALGASTVPAARCKRVIFLFMAGGPSQLELFDWKPKLRELHGSPVPASLLAGKRFAFMDSYFKKQLTLLGTTRRFARHGERGTWISELLPHTAKHADRLAIVRTLQTDVPNHAPAKAMLNTGFFRYGRPCLGSWVTYALGSKSQDLPGFVVLFSGPRGPRGGALNWSAGFLPTRWQGVPLRSSGDPILDLRTPEGVSAEAQRATIAGIAALNRAHFDVAQDPEIATHIASYEMAARMQLSGPELIDFAKESPATLASYGIADAKPSFARNCLLARRLVERGVRFVQLYHTNWDSHGGPKENLTSDLDKVAREVDRPCAALLQDLHDRGLLEDTLVVWSGEFGRTPIGEPRPESTGRNHHVESGAFWLCGGGVRAGIDVGQTDELGYAPIEDPVHVHDLQATILHLLGKNHETLTFRSQGRDFRLTDVSGKVVTKLLA